jgi:hypothetical protein
VLINSKDGVLDNLHFIELKGRLMEVEFYGENILIERRII